MGAYDISTTSAPTGGTCTIAPSSGISLETDFKLTCSNWRSDSIPLSYQFQYQLENGLYSMLFHGYNNTVSSWLPPGNLSENFNVKVKVIITDDVGASASVANLSVQVKPSGRSRPENISGLLMAYESLLNDVIRAGDLSKAAQIANSVLQTVSQDTTISFQNKAKIQDFLIAKIISLPVRNLPDLLQSSSVIGSALQVTDRMSSNTLVSSLTSLHSMTSLLWRTAKLKDVVDIPLVTQSAENLGSCLNSVLKAGAVIASGGYGSGPQEQGVNFVKTTMQVISLVADAVLAVRVPDEGMISIATRELTMTLGRHSLEKLTGLRIQAAGGKFVFPSDSQSLQSIVTGKRYIDTQMLSIPFNPYTWDGTKKRVNSEVLALDLKDEIRNVIKVSNLTSDIIIVTSLQPQEIATENPQYFTRNENLRFHGIDVEFENTLVKLEITPHESTVSLFVYLRYGQRPTIKVHELNATVSVYSRCVWASRAHDKKEEETQCSYGPLEPIKFLAKSPGKYFLGVKSSNASLVIPMKRRKRSCFGEGREKRSCVEVKDPPATPPRSENVSVVPVYDSRTDYNYTLRVTQGNCVHWSEEREMWITDGCQVLSAELNGYLNCSCNHLTSFGGGLLVKPNPIDFDKVLIEFKKHGETGNVAVIVTVTVFFLCYIVVLVIVRKADKKDKRNNVLPIQLPSASNNLQEFEIIISTGVWRNSGTTSRVAIEIYGTGENTGILELSPEEPGADNLLFSRANTDVFVLKVTKPLGTIQGVRIGHDNSGESPSWFLEEIVILDKQFNNSWIFTVNQWFALERGDGRIERTFELKPNQLDFNQEVTNRWWKGLTESHIWVSVATKPIRSCFTRVQRASCCLSVLLTAMLANAMFYELDGGTEQIIQIGPLKFSWRQVIIGIESALIVAPINTLIVFLFQKGAERSESSTGHFPKATLLIYLAWFLLFCACAVSAAFSIFYSLLWGRSISEKWLSSMLITFSQDVAVTEPVKVFFIAMFVAAISKRKASKGKGYESLEEPQIGPSKQRLWKLELTKVEKMRKNQAKKQNISQLFVDVFLYLIFIFLLMAVCYGNRNDHRFLMTKSIREGLSRFSTVVNDNEFWSWLNDVLIPSVFVGKWYNGQEENQTMYIGDKHSLLIGMARVRQLRVKSIPCKVLDHMKTTFPVCYEGYSESNEDKTAFHKPGWNPVDNSTSNDELLRLCPKPWRYQNAAQADTAPKWGQFSFYPGGGFIADLGYDTSTGYSIVENLTSYYWLDKQTRVVMMEFTTFNPSVNLLTVTTYFYEVEASGYKAPFTRVDVISLYSTETTSNKFYLICILLFIVFILFYLGRECYRLFKLGCRYFISIWNWVEFFQITFSVLAVVMYILQTIRVSTKIQKLQENIYANVSFHEAIVALEVENAMLGILIFIVSIKLLRIIRFNSHIAVFAKTLRTSTQLLSSFSFNLFILFVAFLHFGVLIFGYGSEFYSSILKATYFQLELTLGRVKARPINALAEANDTFGRIFAVLILFSLTILSMNFFIAIMNEALFEAKDSVNQSELYDLVGTYDWPRNEERRAFLDFVSDAMTRLKFQQTSTMLEETKAGDVASVDSRRSRSLHFDLISKAITALRKGEVLRSVDETPSDTRRKSFFDKISSLIQTRKDVSSEGNYRRQIKTKVSFRDDVVKSQLKKLHKKKKDLFQRLDNIVQGFSEEEEKFHLICHEIKAYGSEDKMGNVMVTGTET
ncbi:polycystic kidney disease protein 1-like 2 [Stylophora pistillata]|uniref:polycystic kidney disease protein 1-like 2 n=1 Tax=Stylophora pistillata TaxID=50429 RepID=UPI000C040EB8|nr:polycystic kidney disease protein 1-like 2 [Stylophora pistillata]